MGLKVALSAAVVAVALSVACAQPAMADIEAVDFTIHGGNWVHLNGEDGPYGLSLDPTISGEVTIDTSKTDSSGILALDYVTGSRAWTLADLDPASTGIFFFNGALSALNLAFTTQGNLLGTNNTAVISEGSNTLFCNGCVTVDSIQAVPEPSTWMLSILGFGAIGAMMRRRVRQPDGLATV